MEIQVSARMEPTAESNSSFTTLLALVDSRYGYDLVGEKGWIGNGEGDKDPPSR